MELWKMLDMICTCINRSFECFICFGGNFLQKWWLKTHALDVMFCFLACLFCKLDIFIYQSIWAGLYNKLICFQLFWTYVENWAQVLKHVKRNLLYIHVIIDNILCVVNNYSKGKISIAWILNRKGCVKLGGEPWTRALW